MTLTFLLASSTNYGIMVAEKLMASSFSCLGVLTPAPRPSGRHYHLKSTPTALWAQKNKLPLFFLTQKIPADLKKQLPQPDFLVVLDFGYYIPTWLAQLPHLLALNLHPSRLPQYRGASPGPYVIAKQEKTSALSIIAISAKMDAGDLLAQIPFTLKSTWTASDYYDYAFKLGAQHLPQVLTAFAQGNLNLTPQQGQPTYASKITKEQAFIPWEKLFLPTMASPYEALIRAYQPWPSVWTIVPTHQGDKRMQIISASLEKQKLNLKLVKLEGETTQPYSHLKTKILFKS